MIGIKIQANLWFSLLLCFGFEQVAHRKHPFFIDQKLCGDQSTRRKPYAVEGGVCQLYLVILAFVANGVSARLCVYALPSDWQLVFVVFDVDVFAYPLGFSVNLVEYLLGSVDSRAAGSI